MPGSDVRRTPRTVGRIVYVSDFDADPIGTSPPSGWTSAGGVSGNATGAGTVAAWPEGGNCAAIAATTTGAPGANNWFYIGTQPPAGGNIGPVFDVAPGVPLAIDAVANVEDLTPGLTFRVQLAWYDAAGASAGFGTALNISALGPLTATGYPVPPATARHAAIRLGIEGNQPGPAHAEVASVIARRLDLEPEPGPEPPRPEPEPCTRRAWLELNGATLALEDRAAGYFCPELDLGWPEVRDVVNNRPDAQGVDDRTTLFGGRVVSANITALAGAGAIIDAVASSFAAYMVPANRPYLHYVLERVDNPERVLGPLRASGYGWPIAGADQRDIQLQWVAADPFAYGTTEHVAEARAGDAVPPGRTYPLTFDRTYPESGGSASAGIITTVGDVPAQPFLRIFGPITEPQVTIEVTLAAGGSTVQRVWFKPTFRIAAGEYVDLDTVARTAYVMGNPLRPALRYLEWTNVQWPVVPPAPGSGRLSLGGFSTGDSTLVHATWRDGYIT